MQGKRGESWTWQKKKKDPPPTTAGKPEKTKSLQLAARKKQAKMPVFPTLSSKGLGSPLIPYSKHTSTLVPTLFWGFPRHNHEKRLQLHLGEQRVTPQEHIPPLYIQFIFESDRVYPETFSLNGLNPAQLSVCHYIG